MKQIIATVALVLCVLVVGGFGGFVVAGHTETISVVVPDALGFHTDYYSCWQTKAFQVCEPLPQNLPRVTPTDW